MANALYPKFKQEALKANAASSLNGAGATGVYAALIDTDVASYNAGHQFFNSIAAGQVGTEQEIGSKTFVDGLFDGADLSFPAVTGNNVEAIVLFVKTAGANTTWPLVGWFDTGVGGLPVLPNGGAISITWNALGIFQL
ncbi:hypothetical protein LHU53_15780 [Rhodoferax sp. U2-2l]|uniref:hypothetical protein n=1 Tax=Rhodoferax sp. U2-2l TaxID=2884000 RepID=UPI001D0BA28F|nr:hypothetical protein [Rhodoferax sp. U2-2l]MCB8748361.1 hypothetical protein [Rhodoferax sp. U2-2l]